MTHDVEMTDGCAALPEKPSMALGNLLPRALSPILGAWMP